MASRTDRTARPRAWSSAVPGLRRPHPGAWWLWAVGMAAAAAHTTNPLLLALIIAAVALTVAARRPDAPWAVGFGWYLLAGALVVLIRVLFRLITAADGPTVLFTLPRIDLPGSTGLSLLGPVSAEALTAAAYDGLRLAALLICVGAANSLANPKRLLAALPAAAYEAGTVLVVSLSVFPQLVESVTRVRRARLLRGDPPSGGRPIRRVLVPVLADALDRSIALAASMDARGYGRDRGSATRRVGPGGVLLLVAVLGIAIGAYGLLDATAPAIVGLPMLILGLALGILGLRAAGHGVRRTRYRPDPWDARDWLLSSAAVLAVAGMRMTVAAARHPSADPLTWPPLPALAVAGVLAATALALLATDDPGRVSA